MPSTSPRARETPARDTKPELSLSPTKDPAREEGTVAAEAARPSAPSLRSRV